MAGAAAASSTPTAEPGGGGGGENPFWQVTNLYARKNKQGIVSNQALGTATIPGGGAIDAVGFLRGLRLVVRSSGATAGTPTADNPANFLLQAGIQNTDGTEIQQSLISGYAYIQKQRFFRPWLKDPMLAYDYAQSINPSLTYFLQPEVRQQLGALENTDTRQQYAWTQVINTATAVGVTGGTCTASVTPYVDVWAQPDVADLEGVTNQRIPPGVNLQTKVRHTSFTLQNAGADNNFLSPLTGNALRGALLIVRDSNNARQDYLSDPITWTLDDRTLSVTSPDLVFQWQADFYASFGQQRAPRPTGVYPFPRFFNPGQLYGQGWLYTSNATAVNWETTTLSTAANVPGTVELLQEEVYAVGAVDMSLVDM
jgi:hypothetical protein